MTRRTGTDFRSTDSLGRASADSPPFIVGYSPVNRVAYAEARPSIRDGDVLLFSPRVRWYKPWHWPTLLICAGTWHWCVHAGMAAWWHGSLFCVQETSLEPEHVRLSHIVRDWPGKCHVYRPAWNQSTLWPTYFTVECAHRATARMIRMVSRPYGWRNLFRTAVHHTLLGRLLLPCDTDDAEQSSWPLYCSSQVSNSLRVAGGLDPAPRKPDRLTTPKDLARSPVLRYLYTLT